MNKRLAVGIMMIVFALVAGCNSAPKRDPEYAPVRPVLPPPVSQDNGAIYQSGYDIAWFEDIRARRVGDILTIRLVEKTDASKKATTSVTKDNSNSVTNPTLFGTTPQFNTPGILPFASNRNNNLGFSLESAHEFSGEGDSAQSNKLTGDITVTVVEVLPNGYLMVRGEKRLGINQGNEYVKLSGIVRPVDIDATNSVLSTKLADPTIVYVGDGPVAESNVMGWLARFFVSALMPF